MHAPACPSTADPFPRLSGLKPSSTPMGACSTAASRWKLITHVQRDCAAATCIIPTCDARTLDRGQRARRLPNHPWSAHRTSGALIAPSCGALGCSAACSPYALIVTTVAGSLRAMSFEYGDQPGGKPHLRLKARTVVRGAWRDVDVARSESAQRAQTRVRV